MQVLVCSCGVAGLAPWSRLWPGHLEFKRVSFQGIPERGHVLVRKRMLGENIGQNNLYMFD